MFLKRLELSGFKSFADRTELEFVSGITAVVGPNGSGKSNISDAIRWVLGEQSAKSLRGGNMQDIIFSGSDSRKAVNFSDVSLTLDNLDQALPLDFSEITVTRRIHRSGESEYFINKQSCRLKDITELFMDTGIGKEAYSIIGQGRIEEILSNRSEERRGIFEEASGIVKYKARKREAQKRLEETEQNLLRIHDLTSELEDQLQPLKQQSDQAEKYKKIKESLKNKEIALYAHTIGELHTAWTDAQNLLKSLNDEQIILSTRVSTHDAQLEEQRLALRKLDEEIEKLQTALLHTSQELEKSLSAGEVLKERRKHLEDHLDSLNHNLILLSGKIEEKTADLNTLQHHRQQVEDEVSKLKLLIEQDESQYDSSLEGTYRQEVERQKAELLDKLNELASARNEKKYLDVQLEQIERRAKKSDEDQLTMVSNMEQLNLSRNECLSKITQIESEIEDERTRYQAIAQSIYEQQRKIDDLNLAMRKNEQKMEALVARKGTIQELQDDYDGFAAGVREVLKAKQQSLIGIHGAVAEMIRVPSQFEIAMEIALGASLQHLIVDNESAARQAIQFLKGKQLGRATFLPLDIIKARIIPDAERRIVHQERGFVGFAAELISYDSKYANIMGNLLGNIIIAESMEFANRIAAKLQYRYRVVTTDGDVVHAGGSMTGGSVQKKNVSILSRQRIIDELAQEINHIESEIIVGQQSAVQLRNQLEDLQQQLELCRQRGEQKRLSETETLASLERIDLDMKRIETQLKMTVSEHTVLVDERTEILRKRDEIERTILQFMVDESELMATISTTETKRLQAQTAKDEYQQQLTELKVQLATKKQDLIAIENQYSRIQTEINDLEVQREKSVTDHTRRMSELDIQQQESITSIKMANEFNIWKDQYSNQLEFKRAERAQSLANFDHAEDLIREQRIELKNVEEQIRQTDIRLNRMDVELDNLLNKLAEEYEISYELAKERYETPTNIQTTQHEVRELKRNLSQLGDVNLGAIEEYVRVSERFEFLNSQKYDLMEAKSKLYGVIKEIEEEMAKRFLQAFEAIRAQFDGVFKKLFGGGKADLILSEPDQLLETGIEIVAQPPGKKLRNLQLLSGGEKALTAIALLFAILHVKPVPFCVLDEVEAALDEANVSRFAQYLREFSMHTQFIVVTHRKGTMEESDVLYGVTMEDDGVSKLVSVRLDQDPEPIIA